MKRKGLSNKILNLIVAYSRVWGSATSGRTPCRGSQESHERPPSSRGGRD